MTPSPLQVSSPVPSASRSAWKTPATSIFHTLAVMSDRTVKCADGWYVLGDDSRDSEDSRYEGAIPRASVTGRAWLVVWPWRRIGFVN